MNPADLPIYDLREDLKIAFTRYSRLVLQAPTGSGKSTQVPQMLLDDILAGTAGQVVVLQPRRIAARMLASRVARERGVAPGSEVGHQVRFERLAGPDTRILYVTEGILLRRMLNDPSLEGVAAVVFDEFHERHLYGDITLARAVCLQAATRPDLKIAVMSATMDPSPLLSYLDPCAHLVAAGRTFPIEIRYAPQPAGKHARPVWEEAARNCFRLAREFPHGDILIFMPGAYEIRRTVRELEGQSGARDFIILSLYGELSPERQDSVLESYNRRKVVVATNVAETSLTIDGVRIVIDSGLARIPAFDANRAINTLLVEKISRASADQRAGRAGRTAPGVALRLWSERDQEHRKPVELPEIKRVELSETLLMLKAGGISDAEGFPWLEAPHPKILERAEELLRDLGAVARGSGEITEIGRRMSSFPLHPRFSRMFLEADREGVLPAVALMAAFTQVRSIMLPISDKRRSKERDELLHDEGVKESDFFLLLRAWNLARREGFREAYCRKWGINSRAARQAGEILEQFLRIAGEQGLSREGGMAGADRIQCCILAGFSDHLARRLDRGTLHCAMIHGRRGELRRGSVVREAPLLVSAEVEERDVRGDVGVLLGMNTAVQEAWLESLFPEDFQNLERIEYDSGAKRVVVVRERIFRDLVLESREADVVDLDRAACLLAEEVIAGRLRLKRWDGRVEAWINRVNFLSRHCPILEIELIGEAERRIFLEQICFGAVRFRGIKDREVWPTLRSWLHSKQLDCMESFAPERLALPSGKRVKVSYGNDGSAKIAATVQELYGAVGLIKIANGDVPVTVEVLAPNRRPIQVTCDMSTFWENSYPSIRSQLKGRYPKHEWR